MNETKGGAGFEVTLLHRRVVPVAVLESIDHALPLARALAAGGLPVLEVTLRTACALDCIREIRRACPDVLVGAGTILNPEQLRQAVDAGAQFGVSPGLNEEVVRAAVECGCAFMPGVLTPSEVERALSLGCHLQKFFPAEAGGGRRMLQALAGPYEATGVRFVPLGGINAGNLTDYLALPIVAAVGGSWLCERQLVRAQRWSEITALTRQALSTVASIETTIPANPANP